MTIYKILTYIIYTLSDLRTLANAVNEAKSPEELDKMLMQKNGSPAYFSKQGAAE